MDQPAVRAALDRLIRERGDRYDALSRMLGRNAAYIQQFIKRGVPRRLDERDRRMLARYFGVEEVVLGGPVADDAPTTARGRSAPRRSGGLIAVPRLALGASAGVGSLDDDERAVGQIAFDPAFLRDMGARPEGLSMIRVDGDSMAPTLTHGDDIMVDRGDGAARLRDGIYVLRLDDSLMVKRVAMSPRRGRFSVLSDNERYPSWADIDPALVEVIGRVVWTGRRVG